MLDEVDSNKAKGKPRYNDDGWAILQTSERLAKQDVKQKFLIVLSDGLPEESSEHSGSQYKLDRVIPHVTDETDQKIIGLGIGLGTGHVSKYYPNSIANIDTKQMATKISDLLRDIIINYNQY
jgi:cobalamin biosynthesis protein CobT